MNRVALITGASRGLGAVLASFLAGQGYDLLITARGRDGLESKAQGLSTYGVRVSRLAGDVADAHHRRELVRAAEQLGRLDLLVNNASELGTVPLSALADYPLPAFERAFAVNVIAPLALVQATLPMLAASRGLAVNVTSDAAVGAYPGWGGYGASKAALEVVSATLAKELQGTGVSVVTVDPGDMRTQMHQDAYLGEDISDRPLPDVTLPFWAWLLGHEPSAVNGGRYQAQAEQWEIPR